jgi:hypothetical protein
MRSYPTPGKMGKLLYRTGKISQKHPKRKGSPRSNLLVLRRLLTATTTCGSIPIASINLAVPNSPKQSIPCLHGTEIPKSATCTLLMWKTPTMSLAGLMKTLTMYRESSVTILTRAKSSIGLII